MTGLSVTDHAADRYVERVKPGLSREQARGEILALLGSAEPISDVAPSWVSSDYASEESRYVVLIDGICLAVKGSLVMTVLTRGKNHTEAAEEKRRRRAEKKRRQKARKADRLAHMPAKVRFHRGQPSPRRNDWSDAA